jgi:hypothetical protein
MNVSLLNSHVNIFSYTMRGCLAGVIASEDCCDNVPGLAQCLNVTGREQDVQFSSGLKRGQFPSRSERCQQNFGLFLSFVHDRSYALLANSGAISSCDQSVMPPIFLGGGIFPVRAYRQIDVTEHEKISAKS